MRKCLIVLLLPAVLLFILGTNTRPSFLAPSKLPLRPGLSASERVTVDINQTNVAQALMMYSELTGRTQLPKISPLSKRVEEFFGGYLSRWHLVKRLPRARSGIEYHRDGLFTVGEVKDRLEALFAAKGLVIVADGRKHFRAVQSDKPAEGPAVSRTAGHACRSYGAWESTEGASRSYRHGAPPELSTEAIRA